MRTTLVKALHNTVPIMTKYDIQIVSDSVCPWCYIGSKRVKTAIQTHKQAFPDDTFEMTWKPYQLNPNAPTQSVDKQGYFENLFGPAKKAQIFNRLSSLGSPEGIEFKFGGKTGNTRDSHRLIASAKAKEEEGAPENVGLQNKLVEVLFKSYFEQEQDITSHAVLSKAAIEAGMDKADIERVLGSDEFGAIVDREASAARAGGVNGVPHYEINDMYAVEGAQEPQAFEMLFRRVKASGKAAA